MIFQNIPVLDGNEREYLTDCLDTNWISSQGKYLTQFENTFAQYCGVKYGVACSSGTTAIHLALEALGIGLGDEVLVPDYTLIADSNMVILAGAKPVFVDVDPGHWCIDIEDAKRKITPRTKAIICVHMYGHPCDMDTITSLARERGLAVIEDAAQAHGTGYKGQKAGGLADIACFSFYATKTLTTGEGGMVLTDSAELADRLRAMRSHGFEGQTRNYTHRLMGYNYRLTNLHAALGLAQCQRIDEKVAKKNYLRRCYTELLGGRRGLIFQRVEPWAESSFWNVTVLITDEFGRTRDEVIELLGKKGIQSSTGFKSLHRQPVYSSPRDARYPDTSGEFPVSDMLSGCALCLPSGLSLQDGEIAEVANGLLDCRG